MARVLAAPGSPLRGAIKVTRKHFAAVADVIAGIEDEQIRRQVAREMAYAVGRFNSLFNRSRFLEACNAAE